MQQRRNPQSIREPLPMPKENSEPSLEHELAASHETIRALRQSEQNFRILVENATDLIVRLSVDGTCLYANPSSLFIIGYPPEELIGEKAFRFIHPMDRRTLSEFLEPEIMFRFGRRITFRLKKKDGFYTWCEARLHFFSHIETKELQIVAVVRDVTDRVRAERFEKIRHAIAEIKASERSYDAEFEYLLKTFCTTLGWEMGQIWLVDEKRMVLKLASIWHIKSPRLKECAEALQKDIFRPGVGIPGTIWLQEKACLFESEASVETCTRVEEYQNAGFVSAIGSVIQDGPHRYGVLLFLSRRSIQNNPELLEMMTAAGLEVGEFITRLRARAQLKEESSRLGVLVREETAKIRELEKEIAKRQKLEQDVRLAAEIQRALLPTSDFALPGIESSSAAISARYISGDFFDFIITGPMRGNIIIADVSGKGVSAAMHTSAARMIFRTASMLGYQPAQILQEMNRSMFPDLTRTEMFITAQVVQVDMEQGMLISASAGHTEALRYRSSSESIERLPTTGLPIGVDIASEIHQTEILLKPGDMVMLYSDGVTEAANSEGKLFGMERLLDLVRRFAREASATIVKETVEKIRIFSDDMPLADDLTLIVLSACPRTLQREEIANFDTLNEICAFARNAVFSYGSECANAIELIVSELVTNSITHGDPVHENRVTLRILLEAEKISIDFSSPGTKIEISESRLEIPDGLQEGGRGLLLVQDFADRVDYSHASGINYWHIEKKVLEAHR